MTHDFQKGSITVYIILKLFFSNTFRRCNLNVDVLTPQSWRSEDTLSGAVYRMRLIVFVLNKGLCWVRDIVVLVCLRKNVIITTLHSPTQTPESFLWIYPVNLIETPRQCISGVARLFKLGGHFIRWKIVGGAREKTSDKKTVPLTL